MPIVYELHIYGATQKPLKGKDLSACIHWSYWRDFLMCPWISPGPSLDTSPPAMAPGILRHTPLTLLRTFSPVFSSLKYRKAAPEVLHELTLSSLPQGHIVKTIIPVLRFPSSALSLLITTNIYSHLIIAQACNQGLLFSWDEVKHRRHIHIPANTLMHTCIYLGPSIFMIP